MNANIFSGLEQTQPALFLSPLWLPPCVFNSQQTPNGEEKTQKQEEEEEAPLEADTRCNDYKPTLCTIILNFLLYFP